MPTSFDDVMGFHPDNGDVYNEIRGCLRQLLPFVGAGLTTPVYGTWKDALISLAGKIASKRTRNAIGAMARRGEYLEAAQRLEDERGAIVLQRDLVHHFSPKKLDEDDNWSKIREGAIWLMPDLFARPVLTTNFDQALERVYRAKGHLDFEALDPASKDLRGQAARLLGQPCVFKLHGTVTGTMTDYDTLVFTQSQYDRHYGRGGDTREALRYFVANRALLFLGCSLEGDRTVDVLQEMAGPGVIHYAIVNCKRDERDARVRDLAGANIRAIVYESGEYDSVRAVLERLKANVGA